MSPVPTVALQQNTSTASQPDARSGSAHLLRLGLTDYPEALALQQRLHSRVVDGALKGVLLLSSTPTYTRWAAGAPTRTSWRRPRSWSAYRRASTEPTGRRGYLPRPRPAGRVPDHRPAVVGRRPFGVRPHPGADDRRHAGRLRHRRRERRLPNRRLDRRRKDRRHRRARQQGVTTHGFALNVAPDLGYFDHIVPCGIEECRVTSMAAEGAAADIDTVASSLAHQFQQSFGISLAPTRLEQLEEA